MFFWKRKAKPVAETPVVEPSPEVTSFADVEQTWDEHFDEPAVEPLAETEVESHDESDATPHNSSEGEPHNETNPDLSESHDGQQELENPEADYDLEATAHYEELAIKLDEPDESENQMVVEGAETVEGTETTSDIETDTDVEVAEPEADQAIETSEHPDFELAEPNVDFATVAADDDNESNDASDDADDANAEDNSDEIPELKLPKKMVGVTGWICLAIAVGWVALGIFGILKMTGGTQIAVVVISVIAAIIMLVVGHSMTLKVTEAGIKVPFQPLITWDRVEGVHVEPMIGWGKMNTPTLEYAQGRGIRMLELEGLSSIGGSKRAEIVARQLCKIAEVPFHEYDENEEHLAPRRAAE